MQSWVKANNPSHRWPFNFSPAVPKDVVDNAELGLDALDIDDGPPNMMHKQSGKRNNRTSTQDHAFQQTSSASPGAGFEEAIAPDDLDFYPSKRRPSSLSSQSG